MKLQFTALSAALGLSMAMAMAGSLAHAQVPEQGYLCCNMRTDGSWISDSNYAENGKRVIPVGTPTSVPSIAAVRLCTGTRRSGIPGATLCRLPLRDAG